MFTLPSATYAWWVLLCLFSAGNLLAWCLVLRRHVRTPALRALERRTVGWQLLFCGLYVAGCAYRSVFPVFDVPRMGLFDTPLSSVLIGRSVATVAELSFVAQWALLLGWTARVTGDPWCRRAARIVVPLIGVAELCSWYSVLTTSNLGHVFEESLWGAGALLLVASLLHARRGWNDTMRRWFPALCAAAAGYACYMVAVDVPMYWQRWLHDEAARRTYLDVMQGLSDVTYRRTASDSWDHWRGEVTWMSLYFTVGVWTSIALALLHLPPQSLPPRSLAPLTVRTVRPRAARTARSS